MLLISLWRRTSHIKDTFSWHVTNIPLKIILLFILLIHPISIPIISFTFILTQNRLGSVWQSGITIILTEWEVRYYALYASNYLSNYFIHFYVYIFNYSKEYMEVFKKKWYNWILYCIVVIVLFLTAIHMKVN